MKPNAAPSPTTPGGAFEFKITVPAAGPNARRSGARSGALTSVRSSRSVRRVPDGVVLDHQALNARGPQP